MRIFVLVLALAWCPSLVGQTVPPNILFIAVDDLNHWVGHLDGHPGTLTPNIDRLAERGVSFSRAYANAPLCNPSRVSLLTGVMPAHSGVYGNGEKLRDRLPDAVTLPEYFRRHGYVVKGGGKIFHGFGPGDATAWDHYYRAPRPASRPRRPDGDMWAPWGPADDDTIAQMDAWVADQIAAELGAPHDKPFFLAYGSFRPHLAWHVPQRYFDLHPLPSIVLPAVMTDDLDDVPPFARKLAAEVLDISNNRNFAVPGGDHANVIRHGQWHHAVQGYLASISFADAQVGKLLTALDASGHADNTIVVLWGDHGYHLGQKAHWRKHALWEDSLRTTLVISAPGMRRGEQDPTVVSLIDLYPTLVELAGLARNAPRLDGQSLVGLLKGDTPGTRPAVSTYGFRNHSVRTARWRYIRYHDGTEELYDHSLDPYEWTNLAAARVDNYRDVIAQLSRHLPVRNVK